MIHSKYAGDAIRRSEAERLKQQKEQEKQEAETQFTLELTVLLLFAKVCAPFALAGIIVYLLSVAH